VRSHRTFSALTLANGGALRGLVRLATLTSVRLEPIVRQGKPIAMLELRFSAGGAAAVVPLVIVDVAMLLDPERDVLVWPTTFAEHIDDATADELATFLVPWLIAQSLGQPLNDERLWVCDDPSERELFDRARAAGAVGAASAAVSFVGAAPFVYAARFWTGLRVGVAGDQAALGAALAASAGIDVTLAERPTPSGDLLRWYGVKQQSGAGRRSLVIAPAGQDDPEFEMGIESQAIVLRVRSDRSGSVPLIAARPLDSAFCFDVADGAVVGSLDVLGPVPATHPPIRVHRPKATIGTSGGRIFFGVRTAARPGDDDDVDEAFALAEALRAEGFSVDIGDDPAAIAAGGYDLVHVHGLLDASRALEFFEAARAVGAATALHTQTEESAIGGWWGTVVTRFCYEYAADQRSIDDFTALLRSRRLALGDVRADATYEPSSQDASLVRAAVRAADVVFVSGETEEAYIRARFGRTDAIVAVPPAVPTAIAGTPVGLLVGTANYAFVHAPIGPRGNQIVAVRAAERANIPLVVAGTVADPSYLALLRSFSGNATRIITDPSESVLATLYDGATVYLDPRWVGTGRARAARAAVAGARLVIAERRPVDSLLIGEDVMRIDPGDETGMMRALGEAWYAATEIRLEPALCERVWRATIPHTVAAAVAAGYALLTQASSGPAVRV